MFTDTIVFRPIISYLKSPLYLLRTGESQTNLIYIIIGSNRGEGGLVPTEAL